MTIESRGAHMILFLTASLENPMIGRKCGYRFCVDAAMLCRLFNDAKRFGTVMVAEMCW
jgi:hypothetical protein